MAGRASLRLRAADTQGLSQLPRARRPARHQCRMVRVHRWRRLCRSLALAVRRLGLAEDGSRRGAALLAPRRGGMAGISGSTASSRSVRPSRSATSAITRPTPSPAGPARDCHRGGMGGGRAAARSGLGQPARRRRPGPAAPRSGERRAQTDVRRRLGMDPERLPSFSGFTPAEGAVGEYNGKFMCSQMVLRGGSCATPPRPCPPVLSQLLLPHQRWMFSGLRLARDA